MSRSTAHGAQVVWPQVVWPLDYMSRVNTQGNTKRWPNPQEIILSSSNHWTPNGSQCPSSFRPLTAKWGNQAEVRPVWIKTLLSTSLTSLCYECRVFRAQWIAFLPLNIVLPQLNLYSIHHTAIQPANWNKNIHSASNLHENTASAVKKTV